VASSVLSFRQELKEVDHCSIYFRNSGSGTDDTAVPAHIPVVFYLPNNTALDPYIAVGFQLTGYRSVLTNVSVRLDLSPDTAIDPDIAIGFKTAFDAAVDPDIPVVFDFTEQRTVPPQILCGGSATNSGQEDATKKLFHSINLIFQDCSAYCGGL
jgi:hypothetical protein